MKITKARLQEIIQEELAAEGKRTDMSMPALSPEDFVGADIEEKTIKLSLTQKEANDLLIALEAVEQTPEIKALYDKIFDAGLGGGFRE